MPRRVLALSLAVALLAPACSKKSDSGGPPFVDFNVYFVWGNDLARAFVWNNDWNSGEFIAADITAWAWLPHRTVSGSTVTYDLGIRFIACIQNGRLWVFDTAAAIGGGNPYRFCSETAAENIVGFLNTDPSTTSASSCFVFYTTVPSGGVRDLRVAPVSGGAGTASAALEAGAPETDAYTVTTPRNTAGYAFYHAQSTTGSLKRASLGAFPAVTVDALSGTDDVEQSLVKDHEKVVYRRATGELRASTVGGSPSTIYTPGGGETVLLHGKVDLGTDSEIYFTSTVSGSPNSLFLRRVMFDAPNTVTTFNAALTYTALTVNRVRLTGTRVVWGHVRDGTSYLRSFVRATPATSTDLLTGGRSLADSEIYVTYDGAAYGVVVAETLGGSSFRVARADDGASIGSYTFAGSPGPTDALNHMGSSHYDAALDVEAALETARLCFVDDTSLRSITLDFDAANLLTLGSRPSDIDEFQLETSFRAQTCLAGLSAAPAQLEVFYFRADLANTLLRQTVNAADDYALAAH